MKIKILKWITCLLTLTIFICSSSTLLAQYQNYDLAGYVNPDYAYKSLYLNFGSNGSLSGSKESLGSSYHPGLSESFSSSSNSNDATTSALNGNGDMQLNTYRYSQKRQIRHTVSLNMSDSYSISKQKFGSDYSYISSGQPMQQEQEEYQRGSRNNTFSVNAYYSYSGRFYNSKKLFFEIAPSISLSYRHSANLSRADTVEVKTGSYSRGVTENLRLAVGKGRIEEVSDARTAVYILEDLYKKGVVGKVLSDEEVNTFAAELTRLANARSYDSRLKLIQEITAIDSFLVANGYAEKNNGAAYFTSIYDKWQYARSVTREAGYRLSAGVSGSGVNNNSGTSRMDTMQTKTTTGNIYYYCTPFVELRHEKPLSLYWQQSISVLLSLRYYWSNSRSRSSDRTSTSRDNQLSSNFYASYGLAYYPNSRTAISGRISQSCYRLRTNTEGSTNNYSNSEQYTSSDSYSWLLNSSTSLSLQMQYYFSPQFSLNASCSLTHSYSKSDYKRQYYSSIEVDTPDIATQHSKAYSKFPLPSFSVSLTYQIF